MVTFSRIYCTDNDCDIVPYRFVDMGQSIANFIDTITLQINSQIKSGILLFVVFC